MLHTNADHVHIMRQMFRLITLELAIVGGWSPPQQGLTCLYSSPLKTLLQSTHDTAQQSEHL